MQSLAPTPWRAEEKGQKEMKARSKKIIGVLALQGDFLEHVQVLQKLGVRAREVRNDEELESVDALIMPGGESTTMARLMDAYDLRNPLKKRILDSMPVWGTCAGLILLAMRVQGSKPTPLGVMDIEVQRNAFGRQVDSFETEVSITGLRGKPFRAVFIRAPKIGRVGKAVTIIGKLPDGTPVAVRQGHMLATSFHPELSGDFRLHGYFLSMM